ncbi:MAG TPA: hypothetical protein VIE43_13150 [Thermoanaerobaculia bacterium]|jgi:hypothetical protein|nr:hypothetical protein [Thermoanaerobaculia bacterium]
MSAVATEAGLAIDAAQREILLEELATLVVSLRDPETRSPWEALAVAVDGGSIGGSAEEELLGRLEQILEMTLQTGRVRKVHGAESEQALLRLFRQTPRGGASRRATEAVNRTLATLAGQAIETLLFTSQGPGVYRLGVETDRVKLTLEIDRHGITVESLEV